MAKRRFKVGQAPWEQSGGGGGKRRFAVGSAPWEQKEDVMDEAHPDISFTSRLVYKNFGTDQQSGLEYLKKQNPNLQFKVAQESGEIIAKKPEEKSWKKLDPSGFDWQDITDIGYDVPAALGESALTALGGIGGGLAGTAVAPGVGTAAGALTGAAGAGAAAGAASEGLRQSIGQFAGIDQDYDTGQIGTSALFGAASPLLFGTGAGVKQVGKALGKDVAEESVQKLAKAQSGLPVQAKRSLAPRVGASMSGIARETLELAADNLDQIKKGENVQEAAATFVDLTDELAEASTTKTREIGQQLGAAIDNELAGNTINIIDVKDPFRRLVTKYRGEVDELGTGAAADDLALVQDAMRQYLPMGENTFDLDGKALVSLRRRMKELTQITRMPEAGKGKVLARKSQAEKDLMRAANEAIKTIDSKIDEFSNLKDLNKQYRDAINNDLTLARFFKDPMQTEGTLLKLGGARGRATQKAMIQDLEKALGVPTIQKRADMQVAKKLFSDPSEEVLSQAGVTSTTRTLGGMGLGGLLGYGLGSDADPTLATLVGLGLGRRMGSPANMLRAMKLNQMGGAASQAAQMMGPAALPTAPQTFINVWQQMREQK